MTKPVAGNLQSISTAFYGNYACIDTDGTILFRCDEKKKQWYLSRKLAEMVSDNPPTFKLLFTPKGKGHQGDPFFLQDRKNQCVVCGTLDDLTRHHVVPHCYRRFFPKTYNRFGSYDVMMLCEPDHVGYEYYSNQFREVLAKEFSAPVSGIILKENDDIDPKVISFSHALLEHGNKIPQHRREILLKKIKDYLKKEDITKEDLEFVRDVKRKEFKVTTHGEIVGSKLQNESDLNAFNIRWRKHFIEVMDPKFLPGHWEVERIFNLSAD